MLKRGARRFWDVMTWCALAGVCGAAWSCRAPVEGVTVSAVPSAIQDHINGWGKRVEPLASPPPMVERSLDREIEREGPWDWQRHYGDNHRVCLSVDDDYCVLFWKIHDGYQIHWKVFVFDHRGRLLNPGRLLEGGMLAATSIDP